MNIGIFIYPQAEVLDFSGPFEVFSTASRLSQEKDICNVFLLAESAGPIVARGGFTVFAQYGIESHPPIDVLIVSGGVHTAVLGNNFVISWLASQATKVRVLSSVCTGVFLLAKTGLIAEKKVTTHWEDIQDLKTMFPDLFVSENVRWIQDGNLVSSGGISAGIDMSLFLVAELFGEMLAKKTARQMEYDWVRS